MCHILICRLDNYAFLETDIIFYIMFKISLITILIVLGHSDMTFNEFKAKFGKTYDTDEE